MLNTKTEGLEGLADCRNEVMEFLWMVQGKSQVDGVYNDLPEIQDGLEGLCLVHVCMEYVPHGKRIMSQLKLWGWSLEQTEMIKIEKADDRLW